MGAPLRRSVRLPGALKRRFISSKYGTSAFQSFATVCSPWSILASRAEKERDDASAKVRSLASKLGAKKRRLLLISGRKLLHKHSVRGSCSRLHNKCVSRPKNGMPSLLSTGCG